MSGFTSRLRLDWYMSLPRSRMNPNIRTAVRIALATGALSATLVHAQQAPAPEGDAELDVVIVTGSRIASSNMTSTSPILSVTSEEIRTGGRMDVTDMLNQLPQINANYLGQDIGNRTSGLSSAGGVATASLRGLGPSRTLVLVDGRRLGAGSPQTVISAPGPDVDQIPSALVERVEVVTGGASAVYGSDAIAGVINFITKKNFEGLQVDAQFGGNWHDNSNGFAQQRLEDAGETGPTGTGWDGETINATMTAGANILDGRGNVTGYFGYSVHGPGAQLGSRFRQLPADLQRRPGRHALRRVIELQLFRPQARQRCLFSAWQPVCSAHHRGP